MKVYNKYNHYINYEIYKLIKEKLIFMENLKRTEAISILETILK